MPWFDEAMDAANVCGTDSYSDSTASELEIGCCELAGGSEGGFPLFPCFCPRGMFFLHTLAKWCGVEHLLQEVPKAGQFACLLLGSWLPPQLCLGVYLDLGGECEPVSYSC